MAAARPPAAKQPSRLPEADCHRWELERGDCQYADERNLSVISNRQGQAPEQTFTRDWWRGFRRRQSEELLMSVGAAKEAQRTAVTCGSVLAYFAKLRNVLPGYVTPNQIMNMDETGLSVRPMKGKTRKLVSLKSCAVRPTFHEEKDVSRVWLVATVTLGGQALTPLMLTTTDFPFKSEELAILGRTFAVYRTARGYMTAANMMFC
jgi:hypothetical protein